MRLKRILKIALLLFVIIIIGFFIEVGYYVSRPSRAVDLGEIIFLENGIANHGAGSFFLVTVGKQRANLWSAFYGYVHPHRDLEPVSNVIPENMDIEEYRELMRDYMVESQYISQLVALRRAGYEVDMIGEGVEITSLVNDAPAYGYLYEEDIIIAIDGERVTLASEVSNKVKDREAGETVELTVLRNEDELQLTVPTGANLENDNSAFLGIYIISLPWTPVLPVQVSIDTGNISGPSAGLMFVLEILNQSLPEDITLGRNIAGTGSIDLQENVGLIGGVKQKVIAAEKAGADIFLVPSGNVEEASKAAKRIAVYPVANLEEALKVLESLDSY